MPAHLGRNLLLIAAMSVLAACSLPRGAALQSEIINAADKPEANFSVVPVTRASAAVIAKWPATGWSGGYTWLPRAKGPASTVLETGDTVDLVIWDNEPNSLLTSEGAKTVRLEDVPVSPSGTIFVPYVDEVLVRGLTPDRARARIQSALAPVVPSAQVILTVSTSGQINSVDLVGGTDSPGRFPLPSRDYTILSLLAAGGGISESIENPLVRLIRDGRTYEIRAERLFSNAHFNTTLRGGDKVIVQEDRRTFTAIGAAGRESLLTFPQEHLTAMEAVALMGGLSDLRADPEGVLVLREYGPGQVRPGPAGPDRQQVVFTFDLTSADGLFGARNFQIHPGDTVLATESPVARAQTILALLGSTLSFVEQVASAAP